MYVWEEAGKQKKHEIATIKPRTLMLNLSDADVDRIKEKAASAGLSVGELIENFIGDLVEGTYSNGSDERALADEWFDRCWFGMFPDQDLLHYMTEMYGDPNDFLEDIEYLKGLEEGIRICQEEIDTGILMFRGRSIQYPWYEYVDDKGNQIFASKEEFVECCGEDMAELQEQVQEHQESIQRTWNDFLEWAHMDKDSLDMDKEIQKLYEWREKTKGELQLAPEAAGKVQAGKEKQAEKEIVLAR